MSRQQQLQRSDREERMARMFELEGLSDALTSGRLSGAVFEDGVAQLILVLLERLDWTPDAHELVTALPHFPERIGLAEIRATMANLGYVSRLSRVPGHRLKYCAAATMICDDAGELWLIASDGGRSVLFQPGDSEVSRVPGAMTVYRALTFKESDAHAGTARPSPQTSWVSDLFFRFAPELKIMLLLTFVSGLAAVTVAFGISKIFDTVIPTQNFGTLIGLAVGLALVAALDFMMRRLRARVVARVAGRVEYLLSTSLLGKILRLPGPMLANASQSDQFARLKQFETVRDVVGGPVVLLLLELVLGLVLLSAVALIAWQLAVLLFALAMVLLGVAFALAPGIRRASRRLSAAQAAFNETTYEVLAHRRQIRRDGLIDVSREAVNAKLQDLVRVRRKVQLLSRVPDGLSHASLPMAAASAIGVGALLVMDGVLTAGQLIAVTILTWRLFAPVQQSMQVLPKLRELSLLFNQIDMLMKLPEEETGKRGLLQHRSSGCLDVKNLVMRYPNAFAPILMGVQLSIPKGAFVTVTGNSGSGKSTLLRLLAGNLTPQAGVVLIDGLNLSQLSRAYRNRNIAYVAQSPVYFFGTVAQNLRLAAPGAPEETLYEVVRELGLDDWVDDLPDGLQTRIDPATMTDVLTPSIRTLLGIAQALLVDPPILLLDEPVGGLEPALEEKLLNALRARHGKTTIIMVTHRPSLIKQGDFVVLLNEGQAVMRRPQPTEKAA